MESPRPKSISLKSQELTTLYEKLNQTKKRLENSKISISNKEGLKKEFTLIEDINKLSDDLKKLNTKFDKRCDSAYSKGNSPIINKITQEMLINHLKNNGENKKIPEINFLNETHNTLKTSMLNEQTSKYSHDKFYQRGKEIEAHSKELQDLILKEIKKASNMGKMSENSYKLIVNKIENTLLNVLKEIRIENKNYFSFEEFGRMLTILNIFTIIEYDEENKLVNQNNDEFFDSKNYKRRLEEVTFHEQIWMIMSMKSNQKYIETELIYSFLRILMDPSRLTNKLTAKLLEDYLNKFCKNKREDSILESISNNSKKWSLDDLVKNFKLLNQNKLAYSKIGYLKQKKFNEFKQKAQEFSFTPEINLTSKFLESQNTYKFLKNNPIENNKDNIYEKLYSEKNFDNFSPEKSIEYRSLILSPEKRYKLLYKKHELLQKDIEVKRYLKQEKEQEECTFIPNIQKERPQKINKKEIINRLYTVVPIEEKEELSLRVREEREQKELEYCTFAPQINDNILKTHENSDLPKGYKKAIGRIRYGYTSYVKKKNALENIPKGENYEKMRKENIKPFSFLNEETKYKKEKPFVYIDVNVGLGKTGRIGLHKDDDPKTVSKNFAIAFQLNLEMQSSLEELLTFQLENYKNKPDNEEN